MPSEPSESSNEVEQILKDFYRKVFEHAMELGQEFPDDDPMDSGVEIADVEILQGILDKLVAI